MTTKTVTAFLNQTTEKNTTGRITSLEKLTETARLLISHTLSAIFDKKVPVKVTNTIESAHTIRRNTKIAEFSVVNTGQSKFIEPADTINLSLFLEGDPYQTTFLNKLLGKSQPELQSSRACFVTPELGNCWNWGLYPNTDTNAHWFVRIKGGMKTEPNRQRWIKKKTPRTIWLTDTLLTEPEKEAVEEIPVEYYDVFARHRGEIGMNIEFNVKCTPKDDRAVKRQNQPMVIHLKENLLVALDLMDKAGLITVLHISKYASAIFDQRNPIGKLGLLVDLRQINSLIAGNYTHNNCPVKKLQDAAQHLAVKSLFCKLYCSQVYQWSQMVDKRSVEKLSFNFASRTFAYKRTAQCLSRSLSAFSRFMREYTWNMLSMLTNPFNMWTKLRFQPITLLILTGLFVQSVSALTNQVWNW